MSSSYNQHHWQKKIADYQNKAWATKPSPFVQIVAPHLQPAASILELGTGAGQDGIWLEEQGFKVTFSDGDEFAFESITKKSPNHSVPIKFDLTEPFPFNNKTFDAVYAQLVLHYFDDQQMYKIIAEIERVLVNNGVLALMVNTTEDPEYTEVENDGTGIIRTEKLLKRYFNLETLRPFVSNFKPILFNSEGRTPKDDAIENAGMVQFVGQKKPD